jgi:nucleotide-binding universal stress UspA family protein
MALAINADLHLIHVVEMPVSTAEFPVTDFVVEQMQADASEEIKTLWDELIKRANGKVNIFIHVEVGTVEYRIEELCARKAPFVVIMGNGGNFLERVIAGSKVSNAIRNLPYPLIVIPANVFFHSIKKIVLACDLDDIANGISIDFLKDLGKIFSPSIDVINICTPSQDGQSEADASFEFHSWKDKLHEIYPEIHFVRMAKVEEGISEYLSEHPADLLLVFPKKHSLLEFHRSHAKRIAFHSSVPVASVHM